MRHIIKTFLYARTSKDTAIVFAGTLVNVIAGGLFFILAPRILGPSDFGLFSTVIATGMLAANIANFGIDTGILRFAKGEDFKKILTIALKSYLFLGFFIGILGVLISPLIASFLNQNELTNLFRIAFATIIFLLLTNFFVAGLQAKEEFVKASLVNIASNVSRLILLVLAVIFLKTGLVFITSIFFFVTIISVIFGRIFLPVKLQKIEKGRFFDFYKYNFWIAISLIITTIPFDNYLLLKVTGPIQVGLYAAPYKILTVFHQLSSSFSRVLAPRFTSFDTNLKAKIFALKSFTLVLPIAATLLLVAIFATPFINLIFGQDYGTSAQVLKILSVGFLFFFAGVIPTSIILYYLGDSRTSFIISVFRVFIFVVLLLIFIGPYKALGASVAFTITEVAVFSLSSIYAFSKIRK